MSRTLLDSLISPGSRSAARQSAVRFLRGIDPANSRYSNLTAPVVLVGAARGGTTLLANLVGAYPEIEIFHERFTQGKASYADTFGRTRGTQELQRAFVRYLPRDLKQANARWGVKICTYHWRREDYDRFLAAFPRTQVVFVLRDGRDVLISMLKRSKIFRTPEQCAARWLESVQVYDYLCNKLPRQLLSFHYEDLVLTPAKQMETICAFLGVTFRVELLDPQTWPRHGSYAIAPVTAEKAGKWRTEGVPPLPVDLSSQFAASLARLGYGD